MTLTAPALRLTAEAARRLRRGRAGRVHSTFARTVNVALDGLGEAGWVSLHAVEGEAPIPSPFGIACRSRVSIVAGAWVRVTPEAVELGEAVRLTLAGAAVVDTALPAAAPAPAVLGCLRAARRATAAGLVPVVAAVLAGRPAPAGPLARLAAPALARLGRATAALDAAGVAVAARALLGLGPGLTPSGDDCLVGWVAGVWTAGPAGRGLVGAVRPALAALAAERTGALSRAFLAAALAGQVAEPVAAFVAAPVAAPLAGLLATGATSGADLLAGYLLARQALAPSAGLARAPSIWSRRLRAAASGPSLPSGWGRPGRGPLRPPPMS